MEKAVVFGTGKYYKDKRESIEKKYEIIGFLDNSIKPGEKRTVDGKEALNPIDGVRVWANEIIILASVKFVEMYLQLREFGVGNRILSGIDFKPAYDPFEELIVKNNYSVLFTMDQIVIEGNKTHLVSNNIDEWENNTRKLYALVHPEIEIINSLPTAPISRRFGKEHGKPIDRYYIEKFLKDNRNLIHGDVAEFADDHYTKQFGCDVNKSYVLHVNGWGENVIKANLVTGEGIQENMVDCLICTQVLQVIFDLDSAIINICRILKPGGAALLTMHGIAQISLYDYRNWGEYWRFTDMSLERLLKKNSADCEIEIISYGNVKTVTAMLYGLCVEDMKEDDFLENDEQYPFLLGAIIRKGKA